MLQTIYETEHGNYAMISDIISESVYDTIAKSNYDDEVITVFESYVDQLENKKVSLQLESDISKLMVPELYNISSIYEFDICEVIGDNIFESYLAEGNPNVSGHEPDTTLQKLRKGVTAGVTKVKETAKKAAPVAKKTAMAVDKATRLTGLQLPGQVGDHAIQAAIHGGTALGVKTGLIKKDGKAHKAVKDTSSFYVDGIKKGLANINIRRKRLGNVIAGAGLAVKEKFNKLRTNYHAKREVKHLDAGNTVAANKHREKQNKHAAEVDKTSRKRTARKRYNAKLRKRIVNKFSR